MVLLICAIIGVYLIAYVALGHIREAEQRVHLLRAKLDCLQREAVDLRYEVHRRRPRQGPDGRFISKRK